MRLHRVESSPQSCQPSGIALCLSLGDLPFQRQAFRRAAPVGCNCHAG
ncbi:hypothetical protein PPL19_04485 [Pseudomonas psychrotolerans L19]|nr:hypothetical protein PPL19_04485 [Pseudomonas psychrotolerans L19]